MGLIQLLLFIMIILTLLNGLLFFKKLIKLQEETNSLLKKLCDKRCLKIYHHQIMQCQQKI